MQSYSRGTADGTEVFESAAESAEFFADPMRIHYIVLLIREGAVECAQELEHRHYSVGTMRNDLFHVRFTNWSNLPWYIVSIPYGEQKMMEEVAREYGFRVADGIPTLLGFGPVATFPLSGDRVFTLEYTSTHLRYDISVPRS